MHDPQFKSTKMGRDLIGWLDGYPVDLRVARSTAVDSMPAEIKVADGRLILSCDLRGKMNTTNSLPFIIAHDIGHFLAAPLTDLHKPNIGLPMTDRVDPALLGPGCPLTVYEEEAIVYAAVLLKELNCEPNLQTMAVLARSLFKANTDYILAEVEKHEYGRLLSTWNERVDFIAKKAAPASEPSLEESLGNLLGLGL